MKYFIFVALLVSFVGVAPSVQAQLRRDDRQYAPQLERLVIQLNDKHFRGFDQTIFLRQEIQRQHRGINLHNYELRGVEIMAKSQAGYGSAELLVGGRSQDRARVMGNPRDFYDNRPHTFDNIRLRNFGSSYGAWQIRLDGDIIVRYVVVALERDRFSRDDDRHRRPLPPPRRRR